MGDNVPIAIALAPAESETEWRFFLQHLKRPIARGSSVGEVHSDDVANGQEDTFLVSPYGDALSFDNTALGGNGAESQVSDGQSLQLGSGKRRRLAATDSSEEKKADEEDEEATSGVALV
ncbi:hypothetical protein PF002_g5001 [Phytophthora fragariae]|uniref:Uncharacterized protein n=1 Tax=Phytophthora fragariae TaxID=53985 RepID=A0A6A4A2A6_9STRA|nr:hypothetical protein PF002_g5001 [Phytophthora fragariae]